MAWWDWFTWRRREERPPVTPPQDPVVGRQDFLDDIPEVVPLTEEEQLAVSGEWIYVSSTNVNAIKYNTDDGTMDVEFQYDRYYTYYHVPLDFFIEFMRAGSPGRFVWNEIRRPNRFEYVRRSDMGGNPRPPHGGRNFGGI